MRTSSLWQPFFFRFQAARTPPPCPSLHLSQLEMNPSLLKSLVNHVALPPQLPGKLENKIEQVEHGLTGCVLDATRTLRDLTNGELSREWDCIRNTLHKCKAVNAGGKLNKTSLLTEFRRLEHKAPLILHVAEQNAGLLIRRGYE